MNTVEKATFQDLIDGNACVGPDGGIWYPSGPAGVPVANIFAALIDKLNRYKAERSGGWAKRAVQEQKRADSAEAARDVLAKLVASGGFDCPGHDGDCPYGNSEDACICDSTAMGSEMKCWVDWAHQQSSQKD